MRHRLLLPLLSALALAACSADRPELLAPPMSASASRSASQPTAGRYVIASTAGFSKSFTERVAALGGRIDRVHDGAGIAVVSGLSSAAAGQLASMSGISDVEPDTEISLVVPVATVHADVSATQNPSINSVTDPAAAPRFSWQWNMRDIHADEAWAAGKLGSADVTVAILDTGIDYDDPDLNGLVDLTRSVSFVPTDDQLTATYFPTRNAISDYNGHGTNVAAQVSSKAAVHAGVTSKTTLIGVKVLSALGSGALSGVLSGVIWAADHGADVANMSLGGGFPRAGNGRYVRLINQTFNYAKRQGMVVVVAAGNEASDLDHNGNFFASYCDATHVICVSAVGPALATDDPDTPAYYTNYGRKAIDVAGPGGNADEANGYTPSAWPWGMDIASWVWSYCSKTTLAFDEAGTLLGYAGCQAGNRVTGFIGTSQAAPHVAGLAALLVSLNGHRNPDRVKRDIERSAEDLGHRGADPYFGQGRIDVARAIGLRPYR